VAGYFSLAEFFDKMAYFVKNEPTGGQLSLKNIFELMWRFGDGILPVETGNSFREALCYDFCRGEYPSTGIQPSFFPEEWKTSLGSLTRKTVDDVLAKVEKPFGSRVRTFAARFSHDYRTSPPRPGLIDLIFIYVSASGQGLRVEIFTPPASLG
jgi:anaerobic magnesium-protoporphyrin IX monomethyl ester cyclase